jgi:RNA polymerase sigma-70 factor, ECF subfamily
MDRLERAKTDGAEPRAALRLAIRPARGMTKASRVSDTSSANRRPAQFRVARTLTPPLAQRLMHDWRETTAPRDVDEGEVGASFEVLYERHFSFTWRALRHLGVPGSALEDAAQEVWMVVHRRLPAFEGRSGPRTWLFGIAMNVARNRRRGQRRTPEMLALPEQVASARPDPEGQHAGYEAWVVIQRFLDTLDEQRRAVFVCSLLEQLSAAETAEATGLDVASVYHQVRRLRQTFKAYLLGLEGGSR